MRTAYKVRAYPDAEQAAMLRRTFGCVRLVWNKALIERQARYANEKRGTSYRETDAALTSWKKTEELRFLNEVSAVPLQQTLRHQHNAFQSFFSKRARYPRLKVRQGRQSAHYTRAAFRIKADGVWLAKASAPLRIAWSWRDVTLSDLHPTMAVVSLEPDGRWYISFAVEAGDRPATSPAGHAVGIDLGLKDFAVLSEPVPGLTDAEGRIAHPKHMERRERRLKRYQRALARCQRGSANRAKAKRRVARQHSKVRAARRDFLHQSSTALVRRFDRIGLEDLAVADMARHPTLAKSIYRTGWAEFREFLQYKADRAGRQVVAINRWYPSSKTCSACGHLLVSLSLATRNWTCPNCGTRHDRDINAAKNIDTAAGLVVDACGADVRPERATARRSAVNQEP